MGGVIKSVGDEGEEPREVIGGPALFLGGVRVESVGLGVGRRGGG